MIFTLFDVPNFKALGFYHMQNSHDRDNYLKIHWENVLNGSEPNLNKYANTETSHFGESYDYNSLMHYPAASFSKNGEPTMEPIVSCDSELKSFSYFQLF